MVDGVSAVRDGLPEGDHVIHAALPEAFAEGGARFFVVFDLAKHEAGEGSTEPAESVETPVEE